MGTHYSNHQDVYKLLEAVPQVADQICNQNWKHVALMYTGMSGISGATALMLELHRHSLRVSMIYVRKDGEKSHGRPVEVHIANAAPFDAFIFVDDFVSSGATFRRVVKTVFDNKPDRYWGPPVLGYVHKFDRTKVWQALLNDKYFFHVEPSEIPECPENTTKGTTPALPELTYQVTPISVEQRSSASGCTVTVQRVKSRRRRADGSGRTVSGRSRFNSS